MEIAIVEVGSVNISHGIITTSKMEKQNKAGTLLFKLHCIFYSIEKPHLKVKSVF